MRHVSSRNPIKYVAGEERWMNPLLSLSHWNTKQVG